MHPQPTAAPTVSVLMAVHNGQNYLAAAVESIVRQSFADFEFLIVDDGSTDGSAAILQRYATQDSRIQVISGPNQGLTKALNAALRLARGAFIARFDADDVALPARFERQVAAFRANESLVLLGSEVEMISEEGLRLGRRGQDADHRAIRRRLLQGDGGALTHPAVMMRSTALKTVGGYDESFSVGQDLDLFLRLTEVGQASNLPETLLLWRQHDSSVNRTRAHLWPAVKSRAIASTINRVGAAVYSEELFYTSDTLPKAGDPLAMARGAEQNARYKTAAILYLRALKRPKMRLMALAKLLRLMARTVIRSITRPIPHL